MYKEPGKFRPRQPPEGTPEKRERVQHIVNMMLDGKWWPGSYRDLEKDWKLAYNTIADDAAEASRHLTMILRQAPDILEQMRVDLDWTSVEMRRAVETGLENGDLKGAAACARVIIEARRVMAGVSSQGDGRGGGEAPRFRDKTDQELAEELLRRKLGE